VFENRVLRKILGAKTEEVRGEWRKLQNEGFRDLLLDVLGMTCSTYGGRTHRHRGFWEGKLNSKSKLRRSRRR
jgi:hypothetical protein